MEGYISVSEYARLNRKDTGNIRRLLAAGRLKGEKIGKQWVIQKDCPYPSDLRETTGDYKNWRRRIALNKDKALRTFLSDLISDLCSIYGESLSKIILYGSYARGEQTEESDVDIALMLTNKPSREKTNSMVHCVATYELSSGKVLSVIDIDLNLYSEWKNTLPFYKNIQKDGIVLWKSAM